MKRPTVALSDRTLGIYSTVTANRFSLLETLDSDPVPGDTIRNIRSPSITLRVSLVGKKLGQEISAHALLDSGAEGIVIDQDFATRNKLTLQTLVTPLPVKNVNETLNKRGSVKYTTIQHIHIKTQDNHFHEETVKLYVTMLGDNNIIFRTDWLHGHNPEVDWSLPQVAFTRCPLSCTLSKKPLVITSKKAQTCATMINTIHPDPEEWDTTEDTFTTEAIENFIYIHSFAKQDAVHI